jgi:hypothetical protein
VFNDNYKALPNQYNTLLEVTFLPQDVDECRFGNLNSILSSLFYCFYLLTTFFFFFFLFSSSSSFFFLFLACDSSNSRCNGYFPRMSYSCICKPGFLLKSDNRTCEPICGDGLIVGEETCDPPGIGCFGNCTNDYRYEGREEEIRR